MICVSLWLRCNWNLGSFDLLLPTHPAKAALHLNGTHTQSSFKKGTHSLQKNCAIVESDELRLLNQGLEKAHKTVIEALEAPQLSHAAVLLDRDRLTYVLGSETHESHDELAATTITTIPDPSPSRNTTPSVKPSAQSFMSAVRAEFYESAADLRGIQGGYEEHDDESNNSFYDEEDSAPRLAPSDDNTDSDDASHDTDGRERLYYLAVPSTAEDRSILAGFGRDVWRVCVWDESRDQLMFGGGSAAPFPWIDKSEVEWARLRLHSRPSIAGSVATEQDICDVARRTTGELAGAERKQVPVLKGKPSKA
jgi:hypothetical protein